MVFKMIRVSKTDGGDCIDKCMVLKTVRIQRVTIRAVVRELKMCSFMLLRLPEKIGSK